MIKIAGRSLTPLRALFFLSPCLIAPVLLAQNSQQPASGIDCSDPSTALSSACSQNNSGINTDQYGNQLNTQRNLGLPGNVAVPTQNTGQPNRPGRLNGAVSEQPESNLNEQTSERRPEYFPPSPPSEYQRLVQSSTGQMLPIFGANLFNAAPSTFAPVNRIPVTPDYVIGPGDQVLLRVWGGVSLSAQPTVDRNGDIYIDQVGAVHVAGLSFSRLDSYLRAQMGRVFRNFDLNVSLGQLRSVQIFVVGQARRPGAYTVSSLSTLVNALFASGGPSPQGSLRRIQLKRGALTVTEYDVYDLLLRGDKSRDVPLLPGDVIYIPPVGPQVAVAGSVRNPAIYELRGPATAQEAIDLAGGLGNTASGGKLRIERITGRQSRETLDVALTSESLATTVDDGDLVYVTPVSPRFTQTVTLRGNVANPGRYQWHAGMRIRDLIPDKESLLTRSYWATRNQLGQAMPTRYLGLTDPNAPYSPNSPYSPSSPYSPYSPYTYQPSPFDVVPPPQLPNEGENQATQQQLSSQQLSPQQLATQQQILAQQQSNQTGAERAQTRESGNAATRTTQSLAASSGPVVAQTQAASRFAPVNGVGLTSPEIDWAYAVVERQNTQDLTTSLVPFNLGRVVLDGDETQNYTLQAGDVVTIFSQADIRVPQMQQTRLVRLEGEIKNAGVYSVGPGETLRKVVERAGGLTSQAYLFGSQFTRESARRQQQARLEEYVERLQREIDQVTATRAAVSPADASLQALAGQRDLAARLSQVRATGRIVLDVAPSSSGTDSLPDLQLEDGDQLIVPPVPSSINVLGSVYNANSFIFQPRSRAGRYLSQAGGPSRDADRSHLYIIRADGSVATKASGRTLWGDSFTSLPVYPGDTLIVPDKVDRGAFTRNLAIYSSLLGNLGLSAATFYTLTR